MANTFVVSRNHLILGVCLLLAVVLGYLVAEPPDWGSLMVLLLVAGVLCVPLLMRWHHPLLVGSWNAAINPVFFPGRPALWMIMAFASFLISILGRSVSAEKRFIHVPALTRSLLGLLAVVFGTALMTGGVGLGAFGSQHSGGKGYFFILAAVVGYFALCSQAIPRHRALWYVGFFFLSGLTAAIGNLAYLAGPQFNFLYLLFPADLVLSQAAGFSLESDLVRITGLILISQALYCFLLARYGIQGLFDLARPWRPLLLLGAAALSLFGGFRTGIILFGVTFAVLFCVEGLWKTRTMVVVLIFAGIVSAVAAVFVDRMPRSVQRTLSFLPIKVDPIIKQNAQDSTEWRLEMWKNLWPEVPRHLFRGKGYALDPRELIMVQDATLQGYGGAHEMAVFAGDYHNGPLSLVIPFGIYGVAAFTWFMYVAIRVLHHNHRFGDPSLRQINAFLLAFFVARLIMFVCVFGAFYGELFFFTGLVGLSVALNHGEARAHAQPGLARN